MSLPASISDRLRLPLIAAPMLLVSGPDLVIEACRAGVVGSFPTKNCRTVDELERWLARMQEETDGGAPYAPNLIVHKTNTRLHEDMKLVEKYAPALVITSVGSPAPVMDTIHAAGGLVFADVASMRHVERALQVGVDGLILLTAGAGGQTGWANPLAFVRAVRVGVRRTGGAGRRRGRRRCVARGHRARLRSRVHGYALHRNEAEPRGAGLQRHAGHVVARRHRAVARAHRSRNEPAAPLRGTGREWTLPASARSTRAPAAFRRMHRNAGRTSGRPATPWRRCTTFRTWPISSIASRPSTHRQRDRGDATCWRTIEFSISPTNAARCAGSCWPISARRSCALSRPAARRCARRCRAN